MRNFKTSFDGTVVDLDDPKTYRFLPISAKELDNMMFQEIGKVLCYMNIWHKDIFGKINNDGGQKKRVNKKIKFFCKERKNHYDDILWYQEQVFLFIDETENMC